MVKRIAKKILSQEEASYVKAMLKYTKLNKQQILSYFTKPGYDINQRVITQIARGDIHSTVEPASQTEMEEFIRKRSSPLLKDAIDTFCENLKISENKIDNSESKNIEFKLSFTERFDNLLRPILGFSNADGGYIVYGVTDEKEIVGLDEPQINKFNDFNLKKLNEQILTVASSEIIIEKKITLIQDKKIGVIRVLEAERKPVISISNKGTDISLGKIYYRYNAETKEIQAAELEKIIEERTEYRVKNDVMKLLSTILKNGIDNNIILNSKTGQMDLGGNKTFVLDENLLEKINFIKEGKLIEKDGSPVYSVVGEINPVKIEKITVKEDVYKSHSNTLTSAVNFINNEIKLKFQNKTKISNELVKNMLKKEKKYNLWGYHQEQKHGKNVLHCLSNKALEFMISKLSEKDKNSNELEKYIDELREYSEKNNDK